MFKKARIRLTAWYLVIIMAISLSFSVAIYIGVNRELTRLDSLQRSRQARVETMTNFLIQQGLPLPPEAQRLESETLEEARARIIGALGLINVGILVISGLGGYFLAGVTLNPISKMVKDQKEFIGNASHELRTPLTSLKTEIEVALRDKSMKLKDARELLVSNLQDVNSMQKLSNYLLGLSKYQNSEIDLPTERLNLGNVVDRAIDGASSYAKQKGIRIVRKIDKTYINGNEEAIAELATILIDNAIKYSGKSKKIEIMTRQNGLLIVQDFGVGIAAADIPHIFDRFYRADSSRSKEKTDGYGLGLSIAKSIVDRMGAKIEVQSAVGRGSTFSVRFSK
jgi:two-component system sensor histidine kinase CiaH